jgi:CDGSH-type Zn-finger protein
MGFVTRAEGSLAAQIYHNVTVNVRQTAAPQRDTAVLLSSRKQARSGKERPLEEVRITVRPNGPYRIRGPITLVDVDGNEFELPGTEFVALCRCGHSKSKPFCDRTHREAGFQAETRAEPSAES